MLNGQPLRHYDEMRTITSHRVNGCNEALHIHVVDQPGPGGANHHYRIFGAKPLANDQDYEVTVACELMFQNGPILECGTNGITHEALLAIVIDRLQCFQAGPYKCRENALALTHLEEAVHWLQHRTMARLARGVEGTHEK